MRRTTGSLVWFHILASFSSFLLLPVDRADSPEQRPRPCFLDDFDYEIDDAPFLRLNSSRNMSSQVGEGASERDRLLPAHEGDTTNPAAHVEEPADHHTGGQDDTAATDAVPPAWRTSALLPKLGASMFDFFTTGCAMAAVGVG